MPHRLISFGLLLFWAVAAASLFTRDILPDLWIGAPPDLRAIARTPPSPEPTAWIILMPEEQSKDSFRPIGRLTTETLQQRDGFVRMASSAVFDASKLTQGTPLASHETAENLVVTGTCEIDPAGNLSSFRAGVRLGENDPVDALVVEGRLKNDQLQIKARGFAGLTWDQSFPYQPRSLVQNAFQPLDQMPGLQVGQKWESRVVSPLTGRVETGRVEVVGRGYITWDTNPVPVFILVTRVPPFTARTWVRTDGVVLRQEVPFGITRLLLERKPPEHQATPQPVRNKTR
jgi:hypothetical protein